MNNSAYRFVVSAAESRHRSYSEMANDRGNQTFFAKAGKIGLYKIAGKYLSGVLEDHFDARFISSGGEQLVLKSGQEEPVVTKVIIKTMGGSPAEVEAQAIEYQTLSDRCKEYLGDGWVDTTFYASSMPRVLGRQAVVAMQPYMSSEKSFGSAKEVMDYRSDTTYRNHLQGTAERITELYSDWKMLPDLDGPHNIVLSQIREGSQTLRILDTIPETAAKLAEHLWYRPITRLQAHQEVLDLWRSGDPTPKEWSESQELVLR